MNFRLVGLFAIVILVGLGLGAFAARTTAGPSAPVAASAPAADAGGGAGPAGPGGRIRGGPGGAPAGASPAAGAANRPVATGPIESIGEGQLAVRDSAGLVTVRVGPDTRIAKTVSATREEFQVGDRVLIAIAASESTAATSLTKISPDLATAGSPFFGGAGSAAGNSGAGPRAAGSPAAGGRTGSGGSAARPAGSPAGGNPAGRGATSAAPFINGTIRDLSADSITVTTPAGPDRTIPLGPQTTWQQIATVRLDDLRPGDTVTVTGDRAADGSVAARLIRAGTDPTGRGG